MGKTSDDLQERRHGRGPGYIRLKAIAVLLRSFGWLRPLVEERRPPLRPGFQRQLARIPSRQKGRNIKAHFYRSPSAVDAPLPVHISWHGSGFVLPGLGTDYAYVDHHLEQLGPDCVFVDADYCKAPKHPFPAPVHDAIDVVEYVLAQPHVYDAKRITLGGFSAGAALALAEGAHLGPDRIAGVAALYPVVDCSVKPDAYPMPNPEQKQASGVLMPGWLTDFFLAAYIVRPEDKLDPLCSVKFAPPWSFPRLLIASAKVDTLYTEAEELASHLREAGRTDTRFISIDHEGHGFDKRPKCAESQERRAYVYKEVTEFVRQCWSSAACAA
ncbi:uncharacterized protein SRS1_15703 [Sporisorium reilianum f. sp. reilianum]|uniref:Alpha/beta hydrolase fold-3 domain-containing protein n=1 Tax=Sporisorium reilianum f. sp. reilianum TaxID=72559 RepID=A0A2N8ULR5_9BASI|nr:uncharacterized protein SRS1_15703 [Sporisorium reilianum f. sp. reilianum]